MPRKKVPEATPPEEFPTTLPQEGSEQQEEAPSSSDQGSLPLDEAVDGTESEVQSQPEPEDASSPAAYPTPVPNDASPAFLGDELSGDSSDFPLSDGGEPFSLSCAETNVSDAPADGDASSAPTENLDEPLSEAAPPQEDGNLSLIGIADTTADQGLPGSSLLSEEDKITAAPTKARQAGRRRKLADEEDTVQSPEPPLTVPPSARRSTSAILSIDAKSEVETQADREDTIWHEIRNAYRTRRILTGTLGGVEQSQDGKSLVIVEYKGFRVVIPAREMMLILERRPSGNAYADLMRRQNQILSAMMGAEIDFIVRGIDNKTRSIVASRREAMLRKRQTFYLDTDQAGAYRIYEGRLVQARVTAVAEKVIRIEAFGVECPIMARDLAWDWMGDAHERFSVGDRIVVRILSVQRNSLEDISIQADVKSVSNSTDLDNLQKCRVQGKYAGKVTDVHKGMVFVRLTNGVNAIAHACLDRRMPGKRDDVSFVVTHLDMERGVALGIITKIIKQNL